jgi:predicted permease
MRSMPGALERILMAVARLALPDAQREWMLGDIEEEHARQVEARGRGEAACWLAGETLRNIVFAAAVKRPRLKGRPVMRNSIQDIRYAARLLARSPGFTLVAALTLALGIGANTAIFSVVHGVLLKPLPYPDPDRLIRLFEESPPDVPEFPVSPGNFVDFRAQSRAFESLAAYERSDLQIGGERPEQLRAMRVTAGFFRVLGYAPLFGREFTPEDETPERSPTAILSHDLWTRMFGADRTVVGKTVSLSGRTFEIVGVLPAGVQHVGGRYRSYPHGQTVDVWWPRTLRSTPRPSDRRQHFLSVVGRLRPGVTVPQAQDDVREISARLASQYPATNAQWTSHVRPLRAEIVGASETTLLALLAAACAVLFIACLNVAGLLLGRATGRTREIGVRSALGATRARLIRQLVAESTLLACLGATIGVAFAYAAVNALLAFAPADTPRLHMVSVDRAVLAYTLAATALTALLFGLAPAVQLARADVAPALQGGRAAPGGAQHRLRRTLVAAEIALAFVLVVTSGLLLRSFASLLKVDPGFRADHVLTARITLPSARYPKLAEAAGFFERLAERARALPGVRAAGFSSDLPWTGYDENTGFGIVGRTFPPNQGPEARYHFLTPGFVAALGLPIRAGRDLAPGDVATAPPVVLINETTARQFWGNPQSAVGARLTLWSDTPATVVGVVGDLKDVPWADAQPGGVYFAQAQMGYPDMFLAIRTDGDPQSLVAPLTRIVQEIDPHLPVAAVRTLEEISGAALATRRFTLALVAAFGISALFLALVGVYGVMAQSVGQRVREFGVRQALGARPADILRLVLTAGAGMGLVGLAAGLVIALPVTRLMRSLLFRTSPSDPVTLAIVAAVLMLATIAASYLPARRALRIDPATALRRE